MRYDLPVDERIELGERVLGHLISNYSSLAHMRYDLPVDERVELSERVLGHLMQRHL